MDMGRGEKRVRCMERVTWKLTLPNVKYIVKGNLLYDSVNSNGDSVSSNRGSVSIYRGGMGQKMGGRLKREEIYVYL